MLRFMRLSKLKNDQNGSFLNRGSTSRSRDFWYSASCMLDCSFQLPHPCGNSVGQAFASRSGSLYLMCSLFEIVDNALDRIVWVRYCDLVVVRAYRRDFCHIVQRQDQTVFLVEQFCVERFPVGRLRLVNIVERFQRANMPTVQCLVIRKNPQ